MKILTYPANCTTYERYRSALETAMHLGVRVEDFQNVVDMVECSNVIGVMLRDDRPKFGAVAPCKKDAAVSYRAPNKPTLYYYTNPITPERIAEIAHAAGINLNLNLYTFYIPHNHIHDNHGQ